MSADTHGADTHSDEDGTGTTGPVTDLVAGLFLALCALVALVWLIPSHTQAAMSEFDVSPGFFPNLAAWAVLVLSLGLVARQVPRLKLLAGRGTAGRFVLIDIAAWSVVAMFSIFALAKIGFLFVAPVLIVSGMLASGNRAYWMIIGLAVLFPVLVDQAAWYIFTVDLP